MLSEVVNGTLDLDDDGVVQDAVQQSGGDDKIAEHLVPAGDAAAHRTALIRALTS